jgi:hypothetical protein
MAKKKPPQHKKTFEQYIGDKYKKYLKEQGRKNASKRSRESFIKSEKRNITKAYGRYNNKQKLGNLNKVKKLVFPSFTKKGKLVEKGILVGMKLTGATAKPIAQGTPNTRTIIQGRQLSREDFKDLHKYVSKSKGINFYVYKDGKLAASGDNLAGLAGVIKLNSDVNLSATQLPNGDVQISLT